MSNMQARAVLSHRNMLMAVLAAVVIAGVALLGGCANDKALAPSPASTAGAQAADAPAATMPAGQDLVILKDEVTEKAMFIPYQAGSTRMEVIAVRASDGTVRTALNTCQVCNNSGRGYYKQEKNELVCQNCGNRFAINEIGNQHSGCNPVPIKGEDKQENEDTIAISYVYLQRTASLFEKWDK